VKICNLNIVPAFPVAKAEVGLVEIGGSCQFRARNMSKRMSVDIVEDPLQKRGSVQKCNNCDCDQRKCQCFALAHFECCRRNDCISWESLRGG
jgi:hypothetical protein